MSVIQIERLTRDYGGRKGVFDVSFHVNQGWHLDSWVPTGQVKQLLYAI